MMRHGNASLLSTVIAATKRLVQVRSESRPLADLDRETPARSPRGAAFVEALTRTLESETLNCQVSSSRVSVGERGRRPRSARRDHVNVIAECKRRSPARGLLRSAYDAAAIAEEYEAAGAAAISVLTEPTFFDGHPAHLTAVRESVAVPVLRKDFIVDPYQLHEARAIGADAVLLIVAALDEATLMSLLREARSLGLAALVEVHDESELATALKAGAFVIGVNNRNLQTLEVSLDVAERLIDAVPDECVAVAESGLRSGADLVRLRERGYDAFLIGERFMAAPSPGRALAEVIEQTSALTERRASL